MCYDDDILLSFTAGREPLPDDGVGALGTCVAAMAQLCKLEIRHLPLVHTHYYGVGALGTSRVKLSQSRGNINPSLSIDEYCHCG